VGLANIHADVPDVEANKDKILRATSIFKERGINIAVFPEFCLSGYFWDEREDCLAYMKQAVTDVHTDWIESELQPLIGGDLEAIVLNNLVAVEQHDCFLNRSFAIGRDADYLADENTLRQGLPAGDREGLHRERPRRPPGPEHSPRAAWVHHLLRLPLQRAAARVLDGGGGRRDRADRVVAGRRAP
jgi:hypothetical protein